ncbi:hypothetical protein M409DRAFT_25474 [Zasmidium cellare ATCC 36951]|uniref:BTB domain-containing protein n=1 Tax=Zasmidium cellare ATCC 36951 TaxID=1080233 RepID=A0A6A6CD71_ZASCE|nr:uncharacterized protein M409DRAFT_25474 [Zasmidium cellare ATCC 36951]KAF2164128.1 hypothetical protein M409DRAFT_25474 [Zasmidium cellare ATCC 36951]
MATSPNFRECQNQTIIFQDVDDSCVEALVDFLYGEMRSHPEYFPIPPTIGSGLNSEDVKGSVVYFTGLWQLADMYDMATLAESTLAGFKDDFLYLLKDLRWLGWVLDAAAVVEDFPQKMSEIMVECCGRKPHNHKAEETERVFGKYPEFASAVLQKMVGENRQSGS